MHHITKANWFASSSSCIKKNNNKKKNGGNTAILTWLPDALWIGQGVTENPLMPKSTKTMDNITSLVKNLTLHFVFGTI